MVELVQGITCGKWFPRVHHPVVGLPLSWWTHGSLSLWGCAFLEMKTSCLRDMNAWHLLLWEHKPRMDLQFVALPRRTSDVPGTLERIAGKMPVV